MVGIRELDDMEVDAINRIANKYYTKIQRGLGNELSLVIHMKEYRKGGKYWMYSVHVRAIAPTRIFASTKGHDRHINTAIRMAFDDITHQMRHRLHTDEQRKLIKKVL